jgi:hypothetical protein
LAEWDLFVLLGLAPEAPTPSEPVGASEPPPPFGRFAARVAGNVLSMVGRALAASARDQLLVANPRYLPEGYSPAAASA